MASNQTIENIANILGMLKEFNEPYKEAEKRMQEMAFEKDMVELKFEQQLELSEKAIEAQKEFEQWKITDPTMKEETLRKEQVAKDEADAARKYGKEIATMQIKGDKEIAQINNSYKKEIQTAIDSENINVESKDALTRFLKKDAEGLLTPEDLSEAEGALGRKLFYDHEYSSFVGFGKDLLSSGVLAGLSAGTIASGQALMTVPSPYFVTQIAGGLLTAVGAGGAILSAREATQAVAGAGAAGAEAIEPLIGVDLNTVRARKLDSALKNRSLITNELTQSAIEGQRGIEAGTQSGKTLQSSIYDKMKKLEDPDLETFIERYGSESQKDIYKNQNTAINSILNIIY
jgi:hypothetical protein